MLEDGGSYNLKERKMAPKKGGKAPAKKGGGDDDGPDPKEMAGILEAKLMSLRQRIVFE